MNERRPIQETQVLVTKREKDNPMDAKTEIIIASILLIIGWSIIIPAVILTPQYAINPFLFGFIFITIYAILYLQKKLRSLKTSQQQKPDVQTTSTLAVKCLYCNNTFQIPQQNKPFRVKCPKCDRESKLG